MTGAGLLTSGQLVPAASFVWQHPEALGSIFALSMAATLGAEQALHLDNHSPIAPDSR